MTTAQIRKLVSLCHEHRAHFELFSTEDGQWILDNFAEALGLLHLAVANRDQKPARRTDAPTSLDEITREHIQQVLEQVRGNKARAAGLLGVSRRAFYRLLERAGLHKRIPRV